MFKILIWGMNFQDPSVFSCCFQVLFLPTGPEAGVRPLTQVFGEDHTLPLNNGHSRHQKPQVGKA